LKKYILLIKIIFLCFLFQSSYGQNRYSPKKIFSAKETNRKRIVKYGIASFYSDKFNARKTANGEKYNRLKYTAACNVFPLKSWIKVTNLTNSKSVILRINDRMSKRNKRLVDVSKSAARKLGFVSKGITKVKVEIVKHR